VVVTGSQASVAMIWADYPDYPDESDPGPYPVPAAAPVEDTPDTTGDRHVLVIDRDNYRLYEIARAFVNPDGSWNVGSGTVFHLDSNTVRPGGQPGRTSADAAGLFILPDLARYEEAAVGPGGIRHVLRFTVQHSHRAYVPPAMHWASGSTSTSRPPMGMRVRLKAGYVIPSRFGTETRALLAAMKTYGLTVADNGSNWYLSGAPDERWNNDALANELGQVHGAISRFCAWTGWSPAQALAGLQARSSSACRTDHQPSHASMASAGSVCSSASRDRRSAAMPTSTNGLSASGSSNATSTAAAAIAQASNTGRPMPARRRRGDCGGGSLRSRASVNPPSVGPGIAAWSRNSAASQSSLELSCWSSGCGFM